MKNIQTLRFLTQIFFLALIIYGLNPLHADTALVFILAATLLLGNFFCGWLCVFGSYQEFLGKLSNKLFNKTFSVPERLDKALSTLRYLPIFITLVLIDETLNARRAFVYIFDGRPILQITLIAFFVFSVLSLFIHRPFCRWLCVKGAGYGLLSLGRIVTINKNNSCINCKKCNKSCPMSIDIAQKDTIIDPRCINCLKCMSNCPVQGSLSFTTRGWLTARNNAMFLGAVLFLFYIYK